MKAMDGIMFCPCDQPALKRESVEKMLHTPYVHDDMILRFAFGDNVGAPVFFGKAYFEELMHLPEKKGGSAVIKKHLEKVQLVFAQDEKELYDIDIPEDMNRFK